MDHEEEASGGFIKGAVCGGLIGSAAGLLLAPKPGKQLRCDIVDAYHDIADKTEEFGHRIKERGRYFTSEEKTEASTSTFVVGSVIGAVVGVTAAMLMAPKSGSELRRDVSRKVEGARDTAENWRESIADFVDTLNEKVGKRSPKGGRSRIHDVLDIASMGINVWQNLQKRR